MAFPAGPWTVNGLDVLDSDGNVVATVRSRTDAVAIVRLLASAPDLLAEVKAVYDDGDVADFARGAGWRASTIVLISKAEGE